MKRILIVDDDSTIRKLIEVILTKNGFKVEAVSNGIKALSILKKDDFDIVITDLIMPEMDGIELLRELHLKSHKIKVIAMSGGGIASGARYLKMAKTLGVDELIAKPISTKRLLSCVNRLIN